MKNTTKMTSILLALMTSTFLDAYAVNNGKMEEDDDDVPGYSHSSTSQNQNKNGNRNEQAKYRFELLGDVTKPSNSNKSQAKFRIIRENAPKDPDIETIDLRKVEHIGFEPRLLPLINTLDPFDPLPTDWGKAKERVRCIFDYKGKRQEVEITRPKEYSLYGHWEFEDDHIHAQTKAVLKLGTFMEDRLWRNVYERADIIKHTLLSSDPEISG